MNMENRKINHWHEPFYEALQLELYDDREMLSFKNEHLLSQEALQIDVVIIKKTSHIPIKKNIGHMFKTHNGIYQVENERLLTQIIVNTKLHIEENTFLKSLRSDLNATDLKVTLSKAKQYKTLETKSIYLTKLIQANINTFKEAMKTMTEELLDDLEEAIRGTVLEARFFNRGRQEGRQEGMEFSVLKMLNNGFDAIQIADILECPVQWVEQMALRKR